MDVMTWLSSNWGNIGTVCAAVVALASVVVQLLPTSAQAEGNKVLAFVSKVLHVLALDKSATGGLLTGKTDTTK